MEDKNVQRIFNCLDLIRKEVDSARIEPKFSIEKRNRRKPDDETQDDNNVLRIFARLIAYSQNAPSDKISDMLKEGIFENIFHNFEIDEVAQMNPTTVIGRYWSKMRVVRFKKKIVSIINCAKSLKSIKLIHGSFNALLNMLPIDLELEADVEKFWQGFNHLKNELEKVDIPFFKRPTSLLHFLLTIGYDCIKPDLIIMNVAKELGIVSSNCRPIIL